MHKTITIVGCGWLGKQIGAAFLKQGYTVNGSFRSEESKTELSAIGLHPFYWEAISEMHIPNEVVDRTDLLCITLPPSIAKGTQTYAEILLGISQQFPENCRAIFTSSTGIYPKRGETFDETYLFSESEQNTPLFRAEETLRSYWQQRITILRLGGLIGPKRHPIRSLQGRTLEEDGTAPINFIHSADILRAIQHIFEVPAFGGCYNLVSSEHPTKKEYYTDAASAFQVSPPFFGHNSSLRREINGSKITTELGFEYAHSIFAFEDFRI